MHMIFLPRVTNRAKRKNRKKRKTRWWRAVGQALGLASVGKRIVVIGGLFVSSISNCSA